MSVTRSVYSRTAMPEFQFVTSFMITRARLRTCLTASPISGLVDVRIDQGIITAVDPSRGCGDGDFDADGAELLPGLWDSHVHFCLAAVINSCLQLPAEASQSQICDLVRRHLSGGCLMGYGFRAATWPAPPTSSALDAVSNTIPIALISRDLHSVWCNSPALQMVGAAGHPTGYLVEDEAFTAIRALISGDPGCVEASVAELERQAASSGVVGIVDFSSGWAVEAWRNRARTRPLTLKVEAATYPERLEDLIELGAPTGTQLAENLRVGPLKLIADGSMGSRTAFCSLPYPQPLPGYPYGKPNHSPDELVELLQQATAAGITAAVHAIGDACCHQVLDAFEATGASGSIEHAQCVSPTDIPRLARLGLTASIQPLHQIDDAAAVGDVWPRLQHHAYPMRDLLAAGIRLTMGSDAPVAPIDPLRSIAAACEHPYRASQALTWEEALQASIRSIVAVGEPADLVVVDDTRRVLLTLMAGRVTHSEN